MLPDSPQQSIALPPPLLFLHNTPAGAVYGLTGKKIFFMGIDCCLHGAGASAEWRDEGRVLTLKMEDGPQIFFHRCRRTAVDRMQLNK